MEEKRDTPEKGKGRGRGRGRFNRKRQDEGAKPGPRLVQTRMSLRSADTTNPGKSHQVVWGYVPQPWRKDQKTPGGRNPREEPNFLFYSNVRPSKPSGDLIDRIHKHWWGDYDLLESHHGYIQWLFPLFEGGGMNFSSTKLSKGEAKLIRESFEAAKRVVKSFELMLDFYGMRLVDKRTGEIARRKKYFRRYMNLNQNSHNNLRITRILTSLGHLGFSRYKEKWAEFLRKEIEENDELPACRASLRLHWLPTLDVNSKAFKAKTGEMPADRVESVYFTMMEKNNWEEYESEKESSSEEEVIKKRKRALEESRERKKAKKEVKEKEKEKADSEEAEEADEPEEEGEKDREKEKEEEEEEEAEEEEEESEEKQGTRVNGKGTSNKKQRGRGRKRRGRR